MEGNNYRTQGWMEIQIIIAIYQKCSMWKTSIWSSYLSLLTNINRQHIQNSTFESDALCNFYIIRLIG